MKREKISGGIGGIICNNKNALYFGSGGGSGHIIWVMIIKR